MYPDLGKNGRQEEKGTTEDEMVGWHHRLDGDEYEYALGVGDGQGLRPLGLQPARLLCPWDSSGKNTGAGCHFYPASPRGEALFRCARPSGVPRGPALRSESEMERNPEVPSSTRDEALLYYTTPSGVQRGPSQLHSTPDFSEAPGEAP